MTGKTSNTAASVQAAECGGYVGELRESGLPRFAAAIASDIE